MNSSVLQPVSVPNPELPAMTDDIEPPAGLRRISLENRDMIVESAAIAGVQSWSHFFPYLYLFGNFDGARHLFYETEKEAVLIYMIEPKKEMRLSLFLAPFPFNPAALAQAEERMRSFNADRVARIIRLQEADALRVARHGYEIGHHSDEYVYDREAVANLIGSSFSTVRRKIRYYANNNVTLRQYRAGDAKTCGALLRRWRKDLLKEGVRVSSYYRYAQACLTRFAYFPDDLLRGQVIEVDGEVGAFTFGGPITRTLGSVFITVADRKHPGLAYFQRHHFISQFRDLSVMNDAHDSDRPGMAQMKRAFCPVRMHGLFTAQKGARSL